MSGKVLKAGIKSYLMGMEGLLTMDDCLVLGRRHVKRVNVHRKRVYNWRGLRWYGWLNHWYVYSRHHSRVSILHITKDGLDTLCPSLLTIHVRARKRDIRNTQRMQKYIVSK